MPAWGATAGRVTPSLWKDPVQRSSVCTSVNTGGRVHFEWDAQKNRINRRKHGIDFSDVPEVFRHPVLTCRDPRDGYGEERWIAIGWLTATVAVVVYTEPAGDTVRIISARKATRQEVRLYAQSIEN